MKSKIIPEDSFGDDFARAVYRFLVKKLKVDPISEGDRMERKVYNILNPEDLKVFQDKEKRKEAQIKANNTVSIYIKRAKKFWTIFQLYCYNRGELRATRGISRWLKKSDYKEEIARLKNEQKEIFEDAI